uniref:Uncharacterized protein n=1 Tax=Arundo donax TaxID=35708 RepID=A0A0A8YBN6_ARUDO
MPLIHWLRNYLHNLLYTVPMIKDFHYNKDLSDIKIKFGLLITLHYKPS